MTIEDAIEELALAKSSYLSQEETPSIEDAEYVESLKRIITLFASTKYKDALRDAL